MLNPDEFTIVQSKQMGMWPPGDVPALGIWPYINRLKENDLEVLDVGVMKGENAVFMLEKDTNKKIKKVYGVVSYDPERKENFSSFQGILQRNVDGLDHFTLNYNDESCHVVCVHADSDLDTNLEKYYTAVKSNGIFCGNNHSSDHVKKSLLKFRRKNKIGTPIMVALDCWFWYKR